VSTPKGRASRVPGDHNDRHHRRQNDTKDLPSAALARRRNAWGSVDTCCGVSTAAPTTGCAEEMGRIVGLLLERPSLGRVPGGREIPHVGKLREAYHAAHSAFDERKIVSGRSPDGGYVLIDAGSVMYVEIHEE